MRSNAQNRIRSISYAKYGYMFIIPFFAVYIFFQLIPLLTTFKLSLYGNAATGEADVFKGLENFSHLLKGSAQVSDNPYFVNPAQANHEEFLRSFENTLILWIGNFIPQLGLSLLLAVWFTDINLKIKGKTFFKIVMYLPNIVTAASVAALFLMIFDNTKYGPVNGFLLSHNIVDKEVTFVTSKWLSRIVIMGAQTWMWFGNTMIMLMAAIMGISKSLFEAADIDGANSRQVFTKITLPLLKPMVTYTLITSMIGGLQMWDIPYLFRPGTAMNDHTETIAVYIYNTFHTSKGVEPKTGYSAAASVLLFFVTVALGSLSNFLGRDKDAAKKKKELRAARKREKLERKTNNSFGGF